MGSGLIGIAIHILGFVAAVASSVFVLRQVFGGVAMHHGEIRRLAKIGMPAYARVVEVRRGKRIVRAGAQRHLELVIRLEVHPPGRPPYVAQHTALVSERQIPQLQPGAPVQVRFDPAHPTKLVLEAVSTPVGPPQAGAPSPSMHDGPDRASPWGPAPGFTPMDPIPVPTSVKVWLGLGVLGVLVSMVLVLSGAAGGTQPSKRSTPSDEPDPGAVCRQAVACCQVIESIPSRAESCTNYGKTGMRETMCRTALASYRQSAKAQGLHCE